MSNSGVMEAFALFEKEGFTDKDLERLKTGIELQFYNSIAGVAERHIPPWRSERIRRLP